jgi:hypothetical protein
MEQAVNPNANKKTKVVKGPLTGIPPKGRRPTGEDWESGRISSARNQSFRDSQSRIKHLQSAASKSSQSISLMIMIFAFAAMTIALIALATQLLGGLKGNSQLQLFDPGSTQTPLQQPQSPLQQPPQSQNPPGEQPTPSPPQLLPDPSANPDQTNTKPASASEGPVPKSSKGASENP